MTRNMESHRSIGPTESSEPAHHPDLDAHATAALDRLTRWAAKALRAPAALICLVDGDRQEVASCTRHDEPFSSNDGQLLAELGRFASGDEVVRSGGPRVIDDARREGTVSEIGGRTIVSYINVPLLSADGQDRGSFCVLDTLPRHWTIEDIELVTELATSALTEMDLRAARADAEREKRWTEGQQAVLELIAARAPLQQTLSELLLAAEAHAPGMLTSILLREPVRGGPDRLRHIASPNLPRSHATAIDGLTTPIRSSRGPILGCFEMYYTERRQPHPDDQLIIDRSTHLARLAIEQAESAQALRQNVKRARTLAREQTAVQRVATSVAAGNAPEVIFALVAEQVARLLKADCGYVLRFEDDLQYRNLASWTRNPQRAIPTDAVETHLPEGVFSQLRMTGGISRLTLGPDEDPLRFRHRIAAAVRVDGSTWGVVIALRDGRREFPRDDEKRIARFAQLASVAVVNAEVHERLAAQALTDPLTELANRRAFDKRLEEETERAHRHTRALSVVLVDVDRFKTINDRFGHASGDKVLVNLADKLRSAKRTGDLLARIGGDEMALILPDCRPEKATHVARRMLASVAGGSMAQRHGVTLSAGVAGLTVGQTADDLLRCADQALYRAKDDGRNQVVSYEEHVADVSSPMRLSA
ncbi:MAG: sensor domain-containing diguanylate cyclase [Actinomycetota bacterium]|nr:sensor domain-containing diguanylate cyclase [Actinomycetota bacterium]